MKKFELFNAQLEKFHGLLAEHRLVGEFRTNSYPIELVVKQDATASMQVEMFTDGDNVSSHDAKLVLTFPIAGIGVHFYGKFILTDDLLNKIKSHGKKLRDLYLQGFFATFKDSEPQYVDSAINEDASDFTEFFETDEGSDTDEASEE